MDMRGRSGQGRRTKRALERVFNLAPVARALALMLAAGSAHAAAPAFSSGWFAAMSTTQSQARANGVAPASLVPNGVQQNQQAQQKLSQSINNLGRVAAGIAAQQAAQNAARLAAMSAPGSVPDGLAAGGLSVDNNNAWVNAQLDAQHAQTVDANGHVTVTVDQSASRAIANWSSFNVGKNTTLHFDQSAGTQSNGANDWVILNRVNDPGTKPSQILGSITAQGSVYVINRNGIIFGGSSQVDVHALVASSLDFLNTNGDLVQTSADIQASNRQFLANGLFGTGAGLALGVGDSVSIASAGAYQAPGAVTIEAGASIATHANETVSDGGFVLIAAPAINNAGTITTTNGQTILAAGIGVGFTSPPANANTLVPELTGRLLANGVDETPVGTLVNTGLVQADKGYINLLGSSISQDGVVGVTTGVSYPGGIAISTVDEILISSDSPSGPAYRRAGLLSFGADSITADLPDNDDETATSSQNTAFTPGSIAITAGSVWFQGGSLIEAPGASVGVAAVKTVSPAGDTAVPGRIYVDTGATIDVAGLPDVQLPVSDTLVTIPLVGQNELADSPLLRDSILSGMKDVVIDSTLSGTRADGTPWVGSPVLNAAGYVSLIPRSVDQLLVNAGSITLSGAQVMTAQGSALDLDGGYVHYLGGEVKTTRLVDQYGRVVAIGDADPNDVFVGVAGQYTQNHPRWGVSTTWSNPLLDRGVYEDDYLLGGDAGTLDVFGSQAVVLDGAVSGQTVAGTRQAQDGSLPSGGTFALGAGSVLSAIGGVNGNLFNGAPANIIFQDEAPSLNSLAPDFGVNTPLDATALNALDPDDPANVLAWQTVPVDALNAGGFATVNATVDSRQGGGAIVVAADTRLAVQPGGSITLSGSTRASVTILGSLLAPDGDISIALHGTAVPLPSSVPSDIVVGPDAVISVAGQWVNDDLQTVGALNAAGPEYIDGGSISMSIDASSSGSAIVGADRTVVDATGSIMLQPGSVLDVSSGGYLQQDGQLLMSNGLPEGKAGSVSLQVYGKSYGNSGDQLPTLPSAQPIVGGIEMDGTIRSLGFAGGGTLTLQALGFQIGGDASAAPSWDAYLPDDFFESQGFGQYVLNALYDANVASGATVRLTQRNLQPNIPALRQAGTGADLNANGLTTAASVDAYYRQPTGLTMTGGGYLKWQPSSGSLPQYKNVTGGVSVGAGASILADAGAAIGLGSPTQVTVQGAIVAPGGTITLSADTLNAYGFEVAGQPILNGSSSPATQSVWLGPDAVLDVAGVALSNPFPDPVRNGDAMIVPTAGRVLPGGTVVLSDEQGHVVVQAGAVIDVSGTVANFDQPQADGSYALGPVWSDGGSITLGAGGGLDFGGTLRGRAGAPQAQGGTLTILPEQAGLGGATGLIVQQNGSPMPSDMAPGDSFGGTPGVLMFSADTLNGSGITTLVLGGSPRNQGYGREPAPIAFAGDVDLTLGSEVVINADRLVALPAGSTAIGPLAVGTSAIGAPSVTIDAPYVAITGPAYITGSAQPIAPIQALADGTLNVQASFIDIGNQVSLANFGQANFSSSGDIRLSSNGVDPTGNAVLAGELFSPGNLAFMAADIYPASGSTFILDAVGPGTTPTSITFLSSNGTPGGVPLSAGGSLLVDATNIVQSGTVRAPSGSLVFGVGDAGDDDTKTKFGGNLPLVDTQSTTLAGGSITSVSNDGTVIPYGVTADGTEWQYNATGGAVPDVTAPPAKFVSVNGSSVLLNAGATIDLSGGGDLQAEEWVPGTGGSRDVLSRYNISYATSASGTAVPTNPGGADVYAVVPGYHAPVAAYDPVFAQVTQPAVNADGSGTTATAKLGVGQAGVGGMVGQAVYLQGVPGLADGVYTLLPGKYATLPGAYRVTVAGSAGSVIPGTHVTAPDGTQIVAGYLANAISGTRDAQPLLFDVQSGAVWQQYSQYTLTSANSFFPALAASAGTVTPALPMDGGQLVIAATKGLSLGAALNTAAVAGGAPAEVDIASRDIQIVGNGEAALDGYLQISADQLDALGAGSLLLGGTRTQTSSGIVIDAIADSVVVSNDAAHPLTGPEILLVTTTNTADSSSTTFDSNAANGLRIDAGSVIAARGGYPVAKDLPIAIGQAPDDTGANGVSGDGALLRVSNGADATITRFDTTDSTVNAGLLTVGAGATLSGGQSLTLDSSGNLTFDPSASLSGNTIAVDGSAITFTSQTGAAAAALPGFVVGAAQIAQLAAAQTVILRSSGTMNFDGDIDITFGNRVDLSAGMFAGDGGAVTINAPTVAFTNEVNAPASAPTLGAGTLTVNANEVDFGTGAKTMSGFNAVTIDAAAGIVGQDSGTFDFGAAPVTLAAPVYLADTQSDQSVTTTGVLTLNAAPGQALGLAPLGGALSFVGGTLNDNGAAIDAPAGNVSLEATTGDLTIAAGSLVSTAGVALPFFDVVEYAPAGVISLTADAGTVNVQAGATLDFSGAHDGGAAGSLTLSAPDQTVQLAGALKGNAAAGYLGGSFSLTTGGAVDLDSLAGELASSGVNDAIAVQTEAGNLVLSAGNTIKAHAVSLTADGGADGQDADNGNVRILGTIDASGNTGGEIDLYGKSGVDLEGALVATGSSPIERGGNVNIGTTAINTPNVNGTYGYEDIAASNAGTITLGANASIDVSGGTAGGLSNGTVNFRAPIVNDGSGNATVNLAIEPRAPGAGPLVTGARSVDLEAYGIWSTTDNSTGAQHFDGIVDPAGWYDKNGYLQAGTFSSQDGQTTFTFTPNGSGGGTLTDAAGDPSTTVTADQLQNGDPAIGFGGLQNDFFAIAGTAVNASHQSFYGYTNGDASQGPGTLMSFVEHGVQNVADKFANTGIANFAVVPGIELDNPDTAINNGNISILSTWNLGAGASASNLAYRFNNEAPIITFRAVNNVEVEASLTDGFFQIVDPTQPGQTTVTHVVDINPPAECSTNSTQCAASLHRTLYYNSYYYTGGDDYYGGPYTPTKPQFTNIGKGKGYLLPPASAGSFGANPDEAKLEQYYGLYVEYLNIFLGNGGGNTSGIESYGLSHGFNKPAVGGQPTFNEPPPTVAQELASPDAWLVYFAAYQQYATDLQTWANTPIPGHPKQTNSSLYDVYQVTPLAPPPAVLTAPIQSFSTTTTTTTGTPAVMDNSPSPTVNSTHPIPLLTASLNSGASSSFRIVAGADMTSADPLSLQAASLFAGNAGSVTLDNHFAYEDVNVRALFVPTMVRTGTGAIEIAAANDVSLSDTTAPGVIYTAGAPDGDMPVGTASSIATTEGTVAEPSPDLLITPVVQPDGGGDISIHAQNDVTGIEDVVDTNGQATGTAGTNNSQFWWQWMAVGNTLDTNGAITRTSIDFGAFDQGVMSVGGNVSVSAGGNITDLAVSLPTTWYLTTDASGARTPTIVGGGNLSVTAGGNIVSGDYFVSNGTGTLTAGGRVMADALAYQLGGGQTTPPGSVSTLLAMQNGIINVNARQGADIGGVFDPSYLEGDALSIGYKQHADSQGYSSTSAVNVSATTGDIEFGSIGTLDVMGGGGLAAFILPATVNLTALDGGISVSTAGQLYPSATGQLSLVANQSIVLSAGTASNGQSVIGMIDTDPSAMPSPLESFDANTVDPNGFFGNGGVNSRHAATPLHADDTEPVRIYSLNGDIVDGTLDSTDKYAEMITLDVDKPAQVYAGGDILNLAFTGQNLRQDDVTRIIAGGNIDDAPATSIQFQGVVSALVLGGPGTFDIEAGGNIGPLTNQEQRPGVMTGIDAVGNANNSFLPHESASIQVLYGIGPGTDDQAFISAYVDPAGTVTGVPSTTPALIAFMEQYDAGRGENVDTGLEADSDAAVARVGTLTGDQAWAQFQALPAYVQQIFVQKVLFSVLTDVGQDYNNPSSPSYQQYARGYQALNTLFPASLGYTANNLSGGMDGTNGANDLVATGNLDIRSSTIQTQQGGDISILGPGGQALIGSSSAPPDIGNSGEMGILTLEKGDVDIFTDRSVLLAQSRIFTEQGGAMTIWSSNGDINAGKGSKSVADVPPPLYVCDFNHYCTVDARGEVTGAGIATLQTIPGAPASDANLIAPRGTVDAGDAGIRVSGDLNLAALHVANSDNIQVQGKSTGIPIVAQVNVAALTSASAAASAAADAAQDMTRQRQAAARQALPSVITVQVLGFGNEAVGGTDTIPTPQPPAPAAVQPQAAAYDPANPVQFVGLGKRFNPREVTRLTTEERNRLE